MNQWGSAKKPSMFWRIVKDYFAPAMLPNRFSLFVIFWLAVLLCSLGMVCHEDRLRALEKEMVSVCYGGIKFGKAPCKEHLDYWKNQRSKE